MESFDRGLESFDDVEADDSFAEFILSSLDSLGPTASYPWYLSNRVLIGLTGIIWMCILYFIITRYGYGNDGDDGNSGGSAGSSLSGISSGKGLQYQSKRWPGLSFPGSTAPYQ